MNSKITRRNIITSATFVTILPLLDHQFDIHLFRELELLDLKQTYVREGLSCQ